jgi:ribonuclease HI
MSHVIAYTDGANMSRSEVKHAGAAAILHVHPAGGMDPEVFEWGRYLGDQTNNVAELCAIEQAVILAKTYAAGLPLTVVTDSQMCQGLMTYSPARRGWVYKASANRELVERIRSLLPPPDVFKVQWVKGHNEHPYNERADRVAVWCKEFRQEWVARYHANAGMPALNPPV